MSKCLQPRHCIPRVSTSEFMLKRSCKILQISDKTCIFWILACCEIRRDISALIHVARVSFYSTTWLVYNKIEETVWCWTNISCYGLEALMRILWGTYAVHMWRKTATLAAQLGRTSPIKRHWQFITFYRRSWVQDAGHPRNTVYPISEQLW